jgi:hypothetical protein
MQRQWSTFFERIEVSPDETFLIFKEWLLWTTVCDWEAIESLR